MFDDSSGLETGTEDGKGSSDEQVTGARSLSRWLAITAFLLFFLIYLPFQSHPWSWLVALASSYSVGAIGIALGSALDYVDSDDFFGDSRVPKYLAMLLLPHALILVPVITGAYLWFHVKPVLPHWVTVEGRKGSLWEYFGLLLALIASIGEGTLLGNWIKRRVGTEEN